MKIKMMLGIICISFLGVILLSTNTKINANVPVIVENPLYMDSYGFEVGEVEYKPTFVVDLVTQINGDNLLQENQKVLEQNQVDEENYYVSSTIKSIRFYFSDLNIAMSFIQKYNWNENILKINVYQYYYPLTEMAPEGGGIIIDDGGGSDCNSTTNTTGRVKVGIVDSGNIKRLDNSNLCNAIVIEEFPSATQKDHITAVANIVIDEVGGIDDIAFITTVDSSYENSGLLARLEYLYDKDVDVINLSIGTGTPANIGKYTSVAATVDEFVKSTDIPIVAAAGNRSSQWNENYVVSPSIGFNVISVGSTDEFGNWYSSSSYVESTTTSYAIAVNNAPQKPNVVDNAKHLEHTLYGTSYATPRVVGKIVKCIKNVNCAIFTTGNKVEYFMSWIQNNTSKSDSQYNPDSSGFDDKIGAGVISAVSYTFNTITVKSSSDFESGFNMTVSLDSNAPIKISMSYSIDDVDYVLREYKIDIYNTDNILVESYYMVNNSVCFKLPSGSGDYTLTVSSISSDVHNGGNIVIVTTK